MLIKELNSLNLLVLRLLFLLLLLHMINQLKSVFSPNKVPPIGIILYFRGLLWFLQSQPSLEDNLYCDVSFSGEIVVLFDLVLTVLLSPLCVKDDSSKAKREVYLTEWLCVVDMVLLCYY